MKNSYLPNEALFTGPDDDVGQSEARAYISEHGYTNKDVKLVKRDGVIQVITIREIVWQEKNQTL